MTQEKLAGTFRAGLRILAGGPFDLAGWRQFERALGRLVRRGQVPDREDFVQSFIEWLLSRRDVLDDCENIPDDELVGRCAHLVRRHAHEAQTRTETGKLRKALDDVLRADTRLAEHGRLIVSTVTIPPSMPSGPFQACGSRLDHAKLADAAVCLAHENGGINGRSALSRALAKVWALEKLPDDLYSNHHEHSAEDRVAFREAIAHARGALDPRERRLLVDAVHGMPLRTAKASVGLSTTAAHDVRRGAGRKIAAIVAEHGLSVDDRLHLVEALAA